MELKASPDEIVNRLITELLQHGVDNSMPLEDIQEALDGAGVIASIAEITEFTDTIREHRRTCATCSPHYHADGTERDDIDHSELVH